MLISTTVLSSNKRFQQLKQWKLLTGLGYLIVQKLNLDKAHGNSSTIVQELGF